MTIKTKICKLCGNKKDIELFKIRSRFKNGSISYKPICLDCFGKIPLITTKICHNCNEIKDLSLFNINNINEKTGTIYYNTYCKKCCLIYGKIYKGKEESKIKRKERDIENKENIKEYGKKYRKENNLKIKDTNKKWRYNNKEKIKNQKKEYYDNPKNKQSKKEYDQEYHQRSDIKERNKENAKKRRKIKKIKSTPISKIDHNIKNMIRDDIKNNGGKKKGSKRKYLKWSNDELLDHLRFHFSLPGNEWMTMENNGNKGWHLDHIRPRSQFKYDNMEHPDFILCWDLSNLRPLSAKQNIIDGNRRSEKQIKEILDYISKMKKERENNNE